MEGNEKEIKIASNYVSTISCPLGHSPVVEHRERILTLDALLERARKGLEVPADPRLDNPSRG